MKDQDADGVRAGIGQDVGEEHADAVVQVGVPLRPNLDRQVSTRAPGGAQKTDVARANGALSPRPTPPRSRSPTTMKDRIGVQAAITVTAEQRALTALPFEASTVTVNYAKRMQM
ncbi:MAG: hypothetical protein U0Z44_18415 [Kouleothrix sp.]